MHRAFVRAKSGCDRWRDYEMTVAPYETDKPIYYEFTSCPAAEFAMRKVYGEINGFAEENFPEIENIENSAMNSINIVA